MKKVFGIVMVLMMVVGLMIPVFGSAESVSGHASMYVYCANGKRLNLREAPLPNAKLVTRLDNGSKVNILEDSGYGWAMVSCNGKEGFVKTEFLQSKKPTVVASSSNFKAYSAKVYSPNGKKCNMRVRADAKADRIAQLEGNTAIKVIGQVGNWYKIQWANATGYMMKKFVRRA